MPFHVNVIHIYINGERAAAVKGKLQNFLKGRPDSAALPLWAPLFLVRAGVAITRVMMHRWVVRGAHRFELPGAQPGRDHLGGRMIWDMQLKRWLGDFLELVFGGHGEKPTPGPRYAK